jgi:predicted nucleotidyltransferase
MPEVTPEQLQYWRSQLAKTEQEQQLAIAQAHQQLQEAVQVLKQEFGVQQCILFGSLAQGQFTRQSDIDLAVVGLPVNQFYKALAAINRCGPYWVDLKPWEDLEARFRERVLATGQVI